MANMTVKEVEDTIKVLRENMPVRVMALCGDTTSIHIIRKLEITEMLDEHGKSTVYLGLLVDLNDIDSIHIRTKPAGVTQEEAVEIIKKMDETSEIASSKAQKQHAQTEKE